MHNDTCPETAVTPANLDQLERQLRAALYAIWRVQGRELRIVEVKRKEKDLANEQQ